MKKTLIALSLLSMVSIAHASYILKIPLEQAQGGSLPNGSIKINVPSNQPTTPTPSENWSSTTSIYSNWVNQGDSYDCTNWTPSPSTQTINSNFNQIATDCKQEQIRNRQDREVENTTLAIRNIGEAVVESQVLSATKSRQAIGTKETWVATNSTYTGWTNKGSIYNCSWTPATSTVTAGESFTQTASDCKQDQNQTRQDREIETTTGTIRSSGAAVIEVQTLTVSSNQQAVGTKQLAWDCPPFARLGYSWWVLPGGLGVNNYFIWNGAYATNPSNIIDAQSPHKDTSSGYIYRKGVLRLNEGQNGSFYEICRTPIQ